MESGQISSQPHTTKNPKWWWKVREIPKNSGNLGWWNIIPFDQMELLDSSNTFPRFLCRPQLWTELPGFGDKTFWGTAEVVRRTHRGWEFLGWKVYGMYWGWWDVFFWTSCFWSFFSGFWTKSLNVFFGGNDFQFWEAISFERVVKNHQVEWLLRKLPYFLVWN